MWHPRTRTQRITDRVRRLLAEQGYTYSGGGYQRKSITFGQPGPGENSVTFPACTSGDSRIVSVHIPDGATAIPPDGITQSELANQHDSTTVPERAILSDSNSVDERVSKRESTSPAERTITVECSDWELPTHIINILEEIVPEVLERFVERSVDYGDTYAALGVRGQFADIWRKIGKLKRSLWDGQQLTGEQPDEILDDVIGHALLTRLLLTNEQEDQ